MRSSEAARPSSGSSIAHALTGAASAAVCSNSRAKLLSLPAGWHHTGRSVADLPRKPSGGVRMGLGPPLLRCRASGFWPTSSASVRKRQWAPAPVTTLLVRAENGDHSRVHRPCKPDGVQHRDQVAASCVRTAHGPTASAADCGSASVVMSETRAQGAVATGGLARWSSGRDVNSHHPGLGYIDGNLTVVAQRTSWPPTGRSSPSGCYHYSISRGR